MLLINLIVFVLDHSLHLPQMRMLYLDHIAPKWWQFITSSFCHASWQHLSSNIFMLYIFGKIVEEEEGMWGVWWTYFITAVGTQSMLAYKEYSTSPIPDVSYMQELMISTCACVSSRYH